MAEGTALQWPDIVAITVYVILVLAVGFVSSRRSRGDVSGYFLASRSMHWIPVGASIFSSNVGSTLFMGLAGSGAASGIAVAAFELNAIYIIIMLGWVFVPVYLSSGVYTMPEYLRLRFGGQRIRMYLGVLSLLLYIFTKVSGDLFAGALFIQEVVGESSPRVLYSSVLGLLLVAGIFTMMGGLTAVMWTDFVQTILIIGGAFILMVMSYIRVGGYDEVRQRFPYAMPTKLVYDANNNTCGQPTEYYMNLIRPWNDELPWPGTIFGITVLATWHWCTDQVMVQRTLTSRNLVHGKAGCVFASWLKILNLWLLVFPGMIARILFPEEVACVDPDECTRICSSPAGCTNVAYIKLVLELMPVGLRGLMLSVMLAALMSSLTSVFNSASTIFTMDIWAVLRRNAWKSKTAAQVEIEKLIVGRSAVLGMVVISVLWIPVIQKFSNSQLFVYTQSITAFLVPPITAVFVLAMFWDRANEQGAFWGLMVGIVIGVTRFAMEFAYVVPPCGSNAPDPRPELIRRLVGSFNFLYFGILLFFIVLAVSMSVSLMTEPIPQKCLQRLTFATRLSREPLVSIRDYKRGLNKDNEQPKQCYTDGQKRKGSSGGLLLNKLCCLGVVGESDCSAPSGPPLTHDQQMDKLMEFLAGDNWLVNVAAVGCLAAVTFVYAFYA